MQHLKIKCNRGYSFINKNMLWGKGTRGLLGVGDGGFSYSVALARKERAPKAQATSFAGRWSIDHPR